jgi:hypothetical protein
MLFNRITWTFKTLPPRTEKFKKEGMRESR